MEEPNDDQLEQEVTVEVFPDTVTEIIYLPEDMSNEPTHYVPSEEELETQEHTEYEIGSVDTTRMPCRDLVLDQTETFVLLSTDSDLLNSETVFLQQVKNERTCDDDISDLEQYDCSKCDFKTTNYDLLETHEIIHKAQRCNFCGKSFPKASLLTRHHKEEHASYVCTVCNIECTGRKYYSSHIRTHEQKKYICHTCDAIFHTGGLLMNHMETHGTVLLYACNKCDEAFSSTSEVSVHLRQVHTTKNKLDSRKRDSCEKTELSVDIEPR